MENELLPWRTWFGREIKKRRLVKGLRQNDVMMKLQTGGRSALANYEAGLSEPTALNFLRLCEVLEIDITRLPKTNDVVASLTLTTQEPPVKEPSDRGARKKEQREYVP